MTLIKEENFELLRNYITSKCLNSIETLGFVYNSIQKITKIVEKDKLKAAKKLYFLASKVEKLTKN